MIFRRGFGMPKTKTWSTRMSASSSVHGASPGVCTVDVTSGTTTADVDDNDDDC